MRNFSLFLAFTLLSPLAVVASAPVVSSPEVVSGQWTNSQSITMNISYQGAEEFAYSIDNNPTTVPDLNSTTTNSSIYIGALRDGVYWFHAKALSSSGWSDTVHFQLEVDTTGPSRPVPATATALPDGGIQLNWGTSTDTLSGVAYYDVYRSPVAYINDNGVVREFSIRDAIAQRIAPAYKGTSLVDSNFSLGQGLSFFYKIQPFDNAGNPGPISPLIIARAAQLCGIKLTMTPQLGSDQNLHISISSNDNFKGGVLFITGPNDTAPTKLFDGFSGTLADAWYMLSGKTNGDYNLFFSSFDDSLVECDSQLNYYYDNVPPSVKLLAPQNDKDLNGDNIFSFLASDPGKNPSGLASVSLFVDDGSGEKLVGTADLNSQNFNVDWNTLNYGNGRYKVIVRAIDKAGNKTEDSKYYIVRNSFFQRTHLAKVTSDANAARETVIKFLTDLEGRGIFLPSLFSAISSADQNLADANRLAGNQFTLDQATAEAQSALNTYTSITTRISTSTYGSGEYDYKTAQLDNLLKSAGLNEDLVSTAEHQMEKIQAKRELTVSEVKLDGNSFYHAEVSISLSSSDLNSRSVIVLEPIPKKFATSTNDLNSGTSFTILQHDPLLEFGPLDVNTQGRGLTYYLSQNLTKNQADALIADKILDYYVAPPIIVPASADVSSLKESPLSGITYAIAGLQNIQWTGKNTVLAIVAIVIILGLLFLIFLAAMIAIYFLYLKKK